MFFGIFVIFSLSPLTEVSSQASAIPGGNPPGDWQSAVGWVDGGFEPGTAGQQSSALPLSHHTFPIEPPHLPIEPPHLPIEPPHLPIEPPHLPFFIIFIYLFFFFFGAFASVGLVIHEFG